MDFEEEIEEIPRSRPTSLEYNTNRKIEELYAIFGLMAEQQFKLTQENKALARRITILKQSTLELQNENQKLKRKLRDTQEHINLEKDLSEDETDEIKQLDYKEKYKVKGKSTFGRNKISEITIEFKTLYTGKRLLKKLKTFYEAIQEEITRIAVQYYLENNEELTIYNCFKERKYYLYFQESEQLFRHINILRGREPKFLRSITKDYIDLQDSNQENIVEQILSKEELNIKLQRLLNQIKIQIQTLQGQLTLEEAYKSYEYTFLFKRATAIHKTINNNKLAEVIVQRKYLSQIRKIVEFYIEESNLVEYWRTQESQLSETEKAYLNRTLLAFEGARQIQENDQTTQIIFPNTGLTQATQDFLLQHHTQLILEQSNDFRVRTSIINKAFGILLQIAFGQYTVYYAYDQINNKRLGLPTDIFNAR
ncbi:hypothetical protein C2G38_2221609 [Gigaspora rosea]|uniref:Uncharacterized protein n=1 Tax=Gigaspora rosea TaxID=44941 RepID=A0A397U6J8_9GLOM|nr:hypothetical protein C2G38_2221609 [Gigaspora rosea]